MPPDVKQFLVRHREHRACSPHDGKRTSTMTLIKKTLIGLYLGAVLAVVVYVPWKATVPGMTIRLGYGFIFTPPHFNPPNMVAIDYGSVLLHLIAVNCIAGVVWLFIKDRL